MSKKKAIKVILTTSNIKANHGPGDIVDVKPGYAKHYLIPNRLAFRYQGNEHIVQQKISDWQTKDEANKKEADKAFDLLNNQNITIVQKSGLGGSLYGSVSPKDIVKIIAGKGIDIHPSKVQMQHIKLIGDYPVSVKLHSDRIASFTVTVKPLN